MADGRPENVEDRLFRLERAANERGQQRSRDEQEIWKALNVLERKVDVGENERRHADNRAERIERKLSEVQKTIEDQLEEFKKTIVTKDRYQNVERIVYGMVAIVLSAFILGLSATLMR